MKDIVPLIYSDCLSPLQDRKEKEKAMPYNNTTVHADINVIPTPPSDSAKEYLRVRLNDLYYDKISKLRALSKDPKPSSLKEMKKWLKDGNYRLEDHDYKDDADFAENCLSWRDFFVWGSTAPDKEAAKKLETALDAAFQKAVDTISVVTDEQKRLSALHEFEAFTVH